MYPILRLATETRRSRRLGPLAPGEVHVTALRVRPWDIDVFLDLNNGRVLTLFDIGRFGVFTRMGALRAIRAQGWYGTVAGTSIRYRKRITIFQKLELRTRISGWDDRFFYFEQAFWRNGDCCAHAVVRTAITSGKGIIPPSEVVLAMGGNTDSPPLPDWIAAWSAAEVMRPWPPEF